MDVTSIGNVAIGSTKDQALKIYDFMRAGNLAYTIQTSENISFNTNLSDSIYDPVFGKKSNVEDLQFSKSSTKVDYIYVSECSECKKFIVSEKEVAHCPNCAKDIFDYEVLNADSFKTNPVKTIDVSHIFSESSEEAAPQSIKVIDINHIFSESSEDSVSPVKTIDMSHIFSTSSEEEAVSLSEDDEENETTEEIDPEEEVSEEDDVVAVDDEITAEVESDPETEVEPEDDDENSEVVEELTEAEEEQPDSQENTDLVEDTPDPDDKEVTEKEIELKIKGKGENFGENIDELIKNVMESNSGKETKIYAVAQCEDCKNFSISVNSTDISKCAKCGGTKLTENIAYSDDSTISEEEINEMVAPPILVDDGELDELDDAAIEDEVLSINALDIALKDGKGDHDLLDASYIVLNGIPHWIAFYNNKPVALLQKDITNRDHQIFDSEQFGVAISISAQEYGVRDALNSLGFKPIEYRGKLSNNLKPYIEKKVQESISAIKEADQHRQEKMFEALNVAALKLSKNLTKSGKNPLKAAFYTHLSNCGIADPDVVIENVMKSCSDAYHTELLVEANDYMNKTADAQQEIKNLVLNAGYMSVNSNNSLRQRIGNFSTPVTNESQNTLESKSSGNDVDSWQDWYKRANHINS